MNTTYILSPIKNEIIKAEQLKNERDLMKQIPKIDEIEGNSNNQSNNQSNNLSNNISQSNNPSNNQYLNEINIINKENNLLKKEDSLIKKENILIKKENSFLKKQEIFTKERGDRAGLGEKGECFTFRNMNKDKSESFKDINENDKNEAINYDINVSDKSNSNKLADIIIKDIIMKRDISMLKKNDSSLMSNNLNNLNLNSHAIHNRIIDNNNSEDISSKNRRKFDDATIQSKTENSLIQEFNQEKVYCRVSKINFRDLLTNINEEVIKVLK